MVGYLVILYYRFTVAFAGETIF